MSGLCSTARQDDSHHGDVFNHDIVHEPRANKQEQSHFSTDKAKFFCSAEILGHQVVDNEAKIWADFMMPFLTGLAEFLHNSGQSESKQNLLHFAQTSLKG